MAAHIPAASPRENRPTLPTEQRHDTTDVDVDEPLGHANDAPAGPISAQRRRIRALPMAVVLCIICAASAGWLGFRAWQTHQLSVAHTRWVQVARAGNQKSGDPSSAFRIGG